MSIKEEEKLYGVWKYFGQFGGLDLLAVKS